MPRRHFLLESSNLIVCMPIVADNWLCFDCLLSLTNRPTGGSKNRCSVVDNTIWRVKVQPRCVVSNRIFEFTRSMLVSINILALCEWLLQNVVIVSLL